MNTMNHSQPTSSHVVTVRLTPEQVRNRERIRLGVGDAYEHISRRLLERGDDELFAAFVRRFGEVRDFEQYSVIQEFRKRIGE